MSAGSIGTDEAPALDEGAGAEAGGAAGEGPPVAGIGDCVGAATGAAEPAEADDEEALGGGPAELPHAAKSPATASATTAPRRAADRLPGTSR
jgi:hypothetical protein